MERLSQDLKYCQGCQEAHTEEFKKLFDETANKDIKRLQFINEHCKYTTKCIQCKTLVQQVRSLLNELAEIRVNQLPGVCCYCKRSNISGKCKRCEYIVNHFFSQKVKQHEDQQKRFALWLQKLKRLLQMVLEGESICMYMYNESSAKELENLLQELKKPLSLREPEIGLLLPEDDKLASLASLSENKKMLKEVIEKIKTDNVIKKFSSDESLNVCALISACMCKYVMDKKIEKRMALEQFSQKESLKVENEEVMVKKAVLGTDSEILKNNKRKKSGYKHLVNKENIPPKIKIIKSIPEKSKKKISSEKSKSPEELKPSAESKFPKITTAKRTSEEEMTITLIREREKDVKKEVNKKEETLKVPEFGELPILKFKVRQSNIEETSTSILECGDDDYLTPLEMIKGENIVPFDPHYRDLKPAVIQPLLFNVKPVCSDSLLREILPHITPKTSLGFGGSKYKQVHVSYKMNIYKMLPANPEYDWFKRHQNRKIMYYETGEKLADFNDEGRGKWYYKSGRVALDYSNAQELNAGQRYVIYSSGEEIENGKLKPFTVLACFDFLGNGVVYDHYGKVRLKYNQSEGMVVDSKIGPPGRWKWHTLNDPPVLQPIFVDTVLKHCDPCLDNVIKNQKDDKSDAGSRLRHESTDMLTIELENFVKEKANKMLKKLKLFQFRMKVLKINNQFSLRIIDQANIYLLYRVGSISLRLNLGMILISNEIVDTETAEVSQVATPYDRNPPGSQSVADIQKILNKAEKIGKMRQAKVARLMNL
ncbi:hypothetical protein K1T71_000453 [Dendrolimus kikuchii]|uniref:Uncharacterized protein n=1 Tax=Dendrolimus kikuchii TaxID=765133 RepID=A0ACC1DJR8_9NEOP|nr:hypothetical protein K1T71_000453 [Dendrolimus kikuchii]